VPLREIDSLFGFVERSTLYGGRVFAERELSDRDFFQLNNAGIGIRLPISNHFVRRDEYERNLPLLQKYYRPCNSIIVTNDKLARWIRRDFPNYQIDASVIKNLKTQRKINEALKFGGSADAPEPEPRFPGENRSQRPNHAFRQCRLRVDLPVEALLPVDLEDQQRQRWRIPVFAIDQGS
jgi:hypothetical protein